MKFTISPLSLIQSHQIDKNAFCPIASFFFFFFLVLHWNWHVPLRASRAALLQHWSFLYCTSSETQRVTGYTRKTAMQVPHPQIQPKAPSIHFSSSQDTSK